MKHSMIRLAGLLLTLASLCAHSATISGGGGYGYGDRSGLQTAPLFTALQNARTVRGHFTQTRTLPNMSAPLSSDGQFVLSRERGLLWQQLHPFTTRLVFSDQRIIQQVDNKAPQILTPEQHPTPFYFALLFRALLSGEWGNLQRDFQVSRSNEGLLLRPIDRRVGNAIKEVRIDGHEQLTRLTIIERKGGSVEIRFSDILGDNSALTREEQVLYRP
ncbi:outer membrane lipoprotein carrier protein LolA [Aestuariirhabdus sp. LZHN29]|uniref:outer membrane lipoprotein carrier protein LolA n=1 Tax=Aestuariirhabdus sp. LZHN29 TaxID=3417462 RepID=UPI003CF70C86